MGSNDLVNILVRNSLRKSLLWAVNRPACSPLIELMHRLARKQENVLRVLTYHRVDDPRKYPDLYPGVHSATPDEFGRQLDCLGRHFKFVSFQEVMSALHGDSRLQANAVLITFDDAYQGFADYAWPELSRRNVPVVLFVPTAFPDHPQRFFWWDQLHWAFHSAAPTTWDDGADLVSLRTVRNRARAAQRAIAHAKSLPHDEAMTFVQQVCETLGVTEFRHHVLNWDSLRELAHAGVTVAPHTHNHPLMNRISLAMAREEAIRSRDELLRRIESSANALAYPGGALSSEVVEMIYAEQFDVAFTTQRGTNDLDQCDHMQLRRINVGTHSSINAIRLQLLGCGQNT